MRAGASMCSCRPPSTVVTGTAAGTHRRRSRDGGGDPGRKAAARVRAGDRIVIDVPSPEPAAIEPESIPLVSCTRISRLSS